MGTTKRNGTTPEPVPDKARDAAIKFLQPVVDGTRQYGHRLLLAELLSKEIGKPVSRHLVIRWLRDEAAERQQPHLGIGLLLRKVFDKNRDKFNQPWNAAKRRRPRKTKAQQEA